ncbi:chordin-like isoform X1 [Asterias rubens]|uniref:chordin-like isoform X1 n=1 Tax=Asterias rubens TaxID=7604 RepID=UPI00145583AB|nr:chordin-like isoform X1 [Asterias rubens]XP_033642341.1 chordin-like isoform X1 [Asterias rubens]XP_033642342.1 chordin-like isoform X1 [Asterias rubens]
MSFLNLALTCQMMNWRTFQVVREMLIVACLLAFVMPSTHAARKSQHEIPIIAEPDTPHSRGIPGCIFDEVFYDLDTHWHPDLGFGEMACMDCECIPHAKDGRLTGRVNCRDIKKDCVEPACPVDVEPVLLEGECCKSCPSNSGSGSTKPEEGGKPSRDRPSGFSDDTISTPFTGEVYVAMLTGTLIDIRTNAVARASLSLLEETLYYSIIFRRMDQPTSLVFTDALNNTLHFIDIEEGTEMICGQWKNIPQTYIQYLESKLLFLTLATTSHPGGEVRGRVMRHRALEDESFSALLTRKDKGNGRSRKTTDRLGSGGVMMVAVTGNGDQLDFATLVDGITENTERSQEVTFILQLKKGRDVVKETRKTVLPDDLDIADVWDNLATKMQKSMARGQLTISIMVEGQDGELAGPLTPMSSCNTLHAVLSGSQALDRPKATGASGSAIISVDDKGNIKYKILLTGLRTNVVGLTIEGDPKNRRKRRIVADILKDYRDGQASGKYSKAKAKEIHQLLHDGLYINVATEAYETSELRGKISLLPYSTSLANYKGMPVQLSGSIINPPQLTGAGGHAFMVLDSSCALHYQVSVVGLNGDEARVPDGTVDHIFAEIGDINGDQFIVRHVLNEVQRNLASGVLNDVSSSLLEAMDNGNAFIQVSSKNHRDGEIRGLVVLPNSCYSTAATGSRLPFDRPALIEDDASHGGSVESLPNSCFFEKRFRTSGSTWSPEYDPTCATCTCKRGVVICDPVVCPQLACTDPISINGECCPVCPLPAEEVYQDTDSCFFEGDKKYHSIGSQWHPFVPPFGYIQCAICTCLSGGQYDCQRVQCPKLECKKPVRINLSDCCQTCPEEPSTTPEPAESDVIQADEVERGCSFQGDFYRNGEEWHPNIPPFGTSYCVKCRCKNGSTKCKKKNCPKLSCEETTEIKGECCPVCADGSSSLLTTLLPSLATRTPSSDEERKYRWKH